MIFPILVSLCSAPLLPPWLTILRPNPQFFTFDQFSVTIHSSPFFGQLFSSTIISCFPWVAILTTHSSRCWSFLSVSLFARTDFTYLTNKFHSCACFSYSFGIYQNFYLLNFAVPYMSIFSNSNIFYRILRIRHSEYYLCKTFLSQNVFFWFLLSLKIINDLWTLINKNFDLIFYP